VPLCLSPPLPSKPFHLEKKVNVILTKFANSTKLSGKGDKEDDILQSQQVIDNSGHWLNKSEMSFNIKMCEIIYTPERK
jgi:hypothetical protein